MCDVMETHTDPISFAEVASPVSASNELPLPLREGSKGRGCARQRAENPIRPTLAANSLLNPNLLAICGSRATLDALRNRQAHTTLPA